MIRLPVLQVTGFFRQGKTDCAAFENALIVGIFPHDPKAEAQPTLLW